MSEQVCGSQTAAAQNQICGLADLSTPEQFLISALRLWNQGRHDHGLCCCRNLLRNGFQAADLLATEFETFDRVIALIDAAISDRAWIAHPQEPALNRNEIRYLRVLTHCQQGDVTQALQALRVWLPLTAARVVLPDLTRFARACAAVGLVLPQRNSDDTDSSRLGALVIPLRSPSARLH